MAPAKPKAAVAAVAEKQIDGPLIYVAYEVSAVKDLFVRSIFHLASQPPTLPPTLQPLTLHPSQRQPASQEEQAQLPVCMVVLRTPTHSEPLISAPAALGAANEHAVNLTVEHRASLRTPLQLLDTLLNAPLQVNVLAGGELVGSATLDLLPFATEGRTSLKRTLSVNLAPSAALAGAPLAPVAAVTVCVSVTRDGASDDAAALPSRVPFWLVDLASVEASSVLEVHVAGVAPAPAALTAAATAAGGMTFLAACSWQSGDAAAGALSSEGRFENGAVTWGPSRRTFLPPAQFAALREILASGAAPTVEIARCVSVRKHRRAM